MFDELKLSLLELYQAKESSKFSEDGKEQLLTVIHNMETRIEQLENNYEEVKKAMNGYLNSVRTTLKVVTPDYKVE